MVVEEEHFTTILLMGLLQIEVLAVLVVVEQGDIVCTHHPDGINLLVRPEQQILVVVLAEMYMVVVRHMAVVDLLQLDGDSNNGALCFS